MGRDIKIDMDTSTRLDKLFRLIAKAKQISKSRIVLKIAPFMPPPTKAEPSPIPVIPEFRWEKGAVGGKANWPVRRCGIYDGARVTVEPLFPQAWAWESIQW